MCACAGMKFTDLNDFQFLQSGGFGKVYRAFHNPTARHVALKFFGYTPKKPQILLIEKEIENMKIVRDMCGFIQLYGTIQDSKMGKMEDKIHCVKYPIIVMEYLPLDIFTFISAHSLEGSQSDSHGSNDHFSIEESNQGRDNGNGDAQGRGKGVIISENFIKRILIAILEAMSHLHSLGYIHRDLKLENIMLTPAGMASANASSSPPADCFPVASPSASASVSGAPVALDTLKASSLKGKETTAKRLLSEDSGRSLVKIIDLGEMVKLPKNQTSYRMRTRPPGSLGYFAPETIQHNLNSPASDMFQIGCILYSLLSGTSPFRSNLLHSVEGSYFPMTGDAWKEISREAKDLVDCLLIKDPNQRMTAPEVLTHSWIVRNDPTGSNTSLGRKYVSRVTHLMLRQKLKKFFLRSDVLQDQKLRQKTLQEILIHSGSSDYFPGTHHQPTWPSQSHNHSSSFSTDSLDSPHRRLHGSRSHDFSSRDRDSDDSPHSDMEENDEESCTTPSSSPYPPSHRLHHFQSPEFSEELSHMSFLFKLNDLKKRILNSLSPASSASSSAAGAGLQVKKTVSYEEFCLLMNQSDLSELANEMIFRIFDLRHEDRIRMRDFLLTIMTIVDSLTLHHHHQHSEQHSEESQREGDEGQCQSPHHSTHCHDPHTLHTPCDHPEGAGTELSLSQRSSYSQSPRRHSQSSPRHRHHHLLPETPAEIYFSLFDVNDSGTIDKHELQILFHLLTDDLSIDQQPPPSASASAPASTSASASLSSSGELSDLLALIGDKDEIALEDFKIFYDTITSSASVTRGPETVGAGGGGGGTKRGGGGSVDYHTMIHILSSRNPTQQQPTEQLKQQQSQGEDAHPEGESKEKRGVKRKKRSQLKEIAVMDVREVPGPMTRARQRRLG
jgi:serine/threonine protein kinase